MPGKVSFWTLFFTVVLFGSIIIVQNNTILKQKQELRKVVETYCGLTIK